MFAEGFSSNNIEYWQERVGSVLQVENDKCSILKNQLSCYNCGSLGSVLAGIYVAAVINTHYSG